jgi:hypothetical protein
MSCRDSGASTAVALMRGKRARWTEMVESPLKVVGQKALLVVRMMESRS